MRNGLKLILENILMLFFKKYSLQLINIQFLKKKKKTCENFLYLLIEFPPISSCDGSDEAKAKNINDLEITCFLSKATSFDQ